MTQTIVTRIAPSPSGFLHIGNARTALFNWLYARHHGGVFRLRVEDTNKDKSSQPAIDAIHSGLKWLGLDADDTVVYQSQQAPRHVEVAQELLKSGHAYKCFTTPEELAALRDEVQEKRNAFRFQSPWRDVAVADQPADAPYVIRLKAPKEGIITIDDQVQGAVKLGAGEVEDVILLRSDGSPTYMLAVVVDDHDMGITHIIRGDDHLTNSAKQKLIYEAMGWEVPHFAHIPLIHGPDGAKLSKRHGALGVDAYREMGYLPEAMRNYLLRLGWASGDQEFFTREEMIKAFSLKGVGKSASRFDFKKLENLNGHYIRQAENDRLIELMTPFLKAEISPEKKTQIAKLMPSLKERAKTLIELADACKFILTPLAPQDEKAANQLADGKALLAELVAVLEAHTQWDHDSLFAAAKAYAETAQLKLGKMMSPVRVAITGSTASPSMFEVMEALGKQESLARLKAAL